MQNGTYTRDLYTDPGSAAAATQNVGSIVPRFFMDYKRGPNGDIIGHEYVEMLMPGDNKNAPVRKVTDTIRAEFPNQYAAFKRGEELSPEGTPIEMWPAVNPSLARMLKTMNIYTVEQMAEVPDTAIGGIMGGRSLRDRARVYLEASRNTAVSDALAQQNQRLTDEVEYSRRQNGEMAAQLAAMQRQIAAMEAAAAQAQAAPEQDEAPRRGPGRPRKDIAAPEAA